MLLALQKLSNGGPMVKHAIEKQFSSRRPPAPHAYGETCRAAKPTNGVKNSPVKRALCAMYTSVGSKNPALRFTSKLPSILRSRKIIAVCILDSKRYYLRTHKLSQTGGERVEATTMHRLFEACSEAICISFTPQPMGKNGRPDDAFY